MTDPNLTALLECDPEALDWLALLCFTAGADAERGDAPLPIADERVAALVAAVGASWRRRQARTAWLAAALDAQAGVEPWPEEIS